jgi:RTX calcium-binding nonapeptide repeat (4 copies)
MKDRHRVRQALAVAGALAVCGSLVAASGAMATFHLTKIREISGDPGGDNTSYVELQMYAAGNNQISGHNFFCYDAAGTITDTFPVTDPNPPNSGTQRTILVGDSNVLGGRDLDFNPDSCLAGSSVGAICFETVDCVSWGGGAFTGAANLPDNTTPFPGPLPNTDNGDPALDGMALRRNINKGDCTNLLDAADDTNNSAADFAKVPRDPTLNSVAPASTKCIPALKCGGLKVTKKGNGRANLLIGTKGRDVIAGLGGNDIIRGRGGNDVLCGGAGKDRLIGGPGRDRLFGQAGKDTCKGGPKKDKAKTCEVKRTI